MIPIALSGHEPGISRWGFQRAMSEAIHDILSWIYASTAHTILVWALVALIIAAAAFGISLSLGAHAQGAGIMSAASFVCAALMICALDAADLL